MSDMTANDVNIDRVRSARARLAEALAVEKADLDLRLQAIALEFVSLDEQRRVLSDEKRKVISRMGALDKEIDSLEKFLDPEPIVVDEAELTPDQAAAVIADKLVATTAEQTEDPLRCPECGETKRSAAGLGKHRSSKHGVPGKTTTRQAELPPKSTAREIAARRPPSAQVRPLRPEPLNLNASTPLYRCGGEAGQDCAFTTKHESDLLGHVRGSHDREQLSPTERIPQIQPADSQEAK